MVYNYYTNIMSYTISFTNACLDGCFKDFSCHIKAGESAVVVTANKEESELLCRVLSGIMPLSSGVIAINNQLQHELNPAELLQFRQRCCFVPAMGGLVSNLKMLENILLPSFYHNGLITPEQEENVDNLLDFFGYTRNLMILPAKLSIFEKRMTAFIRAVIQNPSCIIYAGCFDNLSGDFMEKLSTAACIFSSTHPECSSLYLTSSEECVEQFKYMPIYFVHNENALEVSNS